MLSTENTLVLVVDIQERLLPALHQGSEFVAECRRMITGANILGLPLVITEQYPKGLGTTVPDIALITKDVPVFAKTQFSAWTEEVQAIVCKKQPENVILIGCEIHICMLQTVLDMRAARLNVFVPQECATSRTAENKVNGLQQIQAAGATVSNIESLLFMLLKDAKHPHFKEISKLIQ
ncbi:isochorismatase family protein [Kingella negevensis]|uniref:isochorismatase family protein n=1 Tax=Kingella negevensis TaxID=1522312 RepID=UPI00050A107B|nr:isochorismatase family protein [Kingella negevensis]